MIGAAGFLGSALVQALEAKNLTYISIMRNTPLFGRGGELRRDIATAKTIFWLASTINPAVAEAQPHRAKQDIATFKGFLSSLARQASAARVVLLSSGGTVYDPATAPPYDEQSPTRPLAAYGRAKLDLERTLLEAHHAIRPGTVIRVSNAYGPGQQAASGQGVIGYWLRALAADQPITIIGDPTSTRDYVFVDDVATALVAVHRHTGPLAPVINIGAGTPTTLGDLAALVRKIANDRHPAIHQPGRPFDVPHSWLDIGLAERELGWRPTTDLNHGLDRAWDWIRSGLDVARTG